MRCQRTRHITQRRSGEEGALDQPLFSGSFSPSWQPGLMDALRAAWLASLGLFVLISAFYLRGFLCGSTGKSCHGTFNKRQQAQKFPFTHRIIARFQRPQSGASSEFYAGIAISTILPKRCSVSIPKRPFKKPLSNSSASIHSWWGETAAQ